MLRIILSFIVLFIFPYVASGSVASKDVVSKNITSKDVASKDVVSKKNVVSEAKDFVQSDKDYLVEKLNYLNRTLSKDHKARKALNLRLAHILALRAEENFIKAERENCKACKKMARSDTIKSLAIYSKMDSLLKSLHPLLHTESLFKRAYLHRFMGEKYKSLAKLKRIVVKKNISSLLITRAWFSIGEIYFELYDYKKSLNAFNEVLKQEENPWRFKSIYRKIWSLSNLSLYDKSVNELNALLKSDLYSHPQLSLGDQKLKQKLENELISLYSYANITDKQLAFFYNFSKQDQSKNTTLEKNKRLFNLAQSLNRIGRISESNKIWKIYISKKPSLEKELQAYFFIVNNELTLDNNNVLQNTGQKIERILSLQNQVKISEDFKKNLNKQAKRFFNRLNKRISLSKKQKEYLLVLYKQYDSTYPENIDILSRFSSLAIDLKKYTLAQDLLQTAVLRIESQKDQKTYQTNLDMKEKMNVLQIEMAELTKDRKRRIQAYNFYIQHGTSEDLIFKAKYQKAYISYGDKEYEKSSRII